MRALEVVKSAEEIMEEVVRRERKTTAEECPFCADAPVKENGKKCVGVCRNPQNVPGPLVFPHEMQTVEDAVRLQLNAMKENNVPRVNHGLQGKENARGTQPGGLSGTVLSVY